MVVKKEDVKCHKTYGNSKKCVCNYNAPTCKKLNCEEYKDKNYKISKIKAKDIKKGDYFLVPFNTTVKESLIKNRDEARFAGFLASDGCVSEKYNSTRFCMNKDEKDEVLPSIQKVFNDFNLNNKLEKRVSSQVLELRSSNIKLFKFASSLVKGKGANKKFTEEVTLLDPKLQMEVLGAYIQADGSYNKRNKTVEITTYSPHLANQLLIMFYRNSILARVNKQPISKSKGTFPTKNTYRYIINIPSSQCCKIKDYVPYKIVDDNFKKKGANKRFFWGNYVVSPVVSNESLIMKEMFMILGSQVVIQ